MVFPYLKQPVHSVCRRLSEYVCNKKSNLSVSADVTTAKELIGIAESVADHIVILKTHIDIISDFTFESIDKLRKIADNSGFLIFEDRKFSDIGNTVMHQVRDGLYHISSWADIINAHLLPGEFIIDGLRKGCESRDIGLLLVAQMSSRKNLFSDAYTSSVIKAAEENQDFVIGFIAQEKLSRYDNLITMTPGVSIQQHSDGLGQSYCNPEAVIDCRGSDIIIVGRSIYCSDDPRKTAKDYQKLAWNILERRAKIK